MASEMIKEGKRLVKELGVHPTKVVEGIENGVKQACKLLEKEAKKITLKDKELEQVIKTSLNSKLDGSKLSSLVIKSIRTVGENSIYNNSFDFDKSIKIIRKINVSDMVFNGIVLERRRMDSEMPIKVDKPKIMILKLDLKPVKESWLKENNRYEEILSMENDRLSKSKKIVDEIVSTGANTLLIASPEIDEVIENLLVSKKIFGIRISSDEIEFLSRYLGTRPVRMQEDLKGETIVGTADYIYENEDEGLIYSVNGSGKKIVSIMVSGTPTETSLERWRSALDGVNAAEAALNKGFVAGGGSAEVDVSDK
jgi:chaperonin GroEL (HSP60 family)